MHLSIFGLNFAISISNGTMKIRSRSLKLYHLFAMSCKLGQNQLTQSEDNVHLSIFALNLAVFILM